jgi:hypothetical protein
MGNCYGRDPQTEVAYHNTTVIAEHQALRKVFVKAVTARIPWHERGEGTIIRRFSI